MTSYEVTDIRTGCDLMAWRVAYSLVKLRAQLNEAYPNRSKASDGSIGDAAHFAEGSASDHNPWLPGEVVSAIDITHDPANGVDIAKLAQTLIDSRDDRIKYIIRNAQIVIPSSSTGWSWRPYSGVNAHSSHMHISVNTNNYDNDRDWSIGGNMKPTVGGVRYAFLLAFNHEPTQADIDGWTSGANGDLEKLLGTLYGQNEWFRRDAVSYGPVKRALDAANARIAELEAGNSPKYEKVTEVYRKVA